ncbi:MAG: hypothetical protein M3144_09165 [Actinomycetota bacterium]|nr:hypothetical protein [Actinomycetota bacterium]
MDKQRAPLGGAASEGGGPMSHNVVGQSYALTVLTPIIAGHEIQLRAALRSLPVGGDSPLARVPRTHFGRWVIVPQPAFEGPPQRPDPWKSQYLIFTSCFDGDLDSYLYDLCTLMGDDADRVWSHCVGYPGSAEPAAFARYLRHNQVDTQVFFAAYPDATVDDVRESLARRDQLLAFVLATQGVDDLELHHRFREAFGGGRP